MTERYISDRNFPDKAIDALDEAGARTHLVDVNVPDAILLLEKKIEEVKDAKINAVNAQNFEIAANYRDNEKNLTLQLDLAKKEWEEETE